MRHIPKRSVLSLTGFPYHQDRVSTINQGHVQPGQSDHGAKKRPNWSSCKNLNHVDCHYHMSKLTYQPDSNAKKHSCHHSLPMYILRQAEELIHKCLLDIILHHMRVTDDSGRVEMEKHLWEHRESGLSCDIWRKNDKPVKHGKYSELREHCSGI